MNPQKQPTTLPVALAAASLITALLALVVASVGVSPALAAAKQITSGNIKNNSVKSADIKDGNLTGKDIKNDSLTGDDVNEGSLAKVPAAATADNASNLGGKSLRQIAQWAYIQSNATVTASSGGVTATNLEAGYYRISFPSSVAGCGLNVSPTTAGPIGDTSPLDAGQEGAAYSTTSPNDVQVHTYNGAATLTNDQFFITVQC